MADCVNFLTAEDISNWSERQHNKLKKSARILKVLESVSKYFNKFLTFLISGNFSKKSIQFAHVFNLAF